MSQETNLGDTSVSPNVGEICEVCTLSIDPNKPHIYAVNDIMAEGPYHPECYEKGASDTGVSNGQVNFHFDNEAHFTWPPHDSEQYEAYREFLAMLQRRVETLPTTEEIPEPSELPTTEDLVSGMSYSELIRVGSALLSDRLTNGTKRSQLEELIQDEIVRRDERTISA